MLRSRRGPPQDAAHRRRPRCSSTTRLPLILLLVVVVLSNPQYRYYGSVVFAAAAGMTELMDVTTGKLQSIPGQAKSIITVIPSPGSPCRLLGNKKDEREASRVVLASASSSSSSSSDNKDNDKDEMALLVCRGATLTSQLLNDDEDNTDATVGRCLALCGTVSDCIVVDGITLGDVELRHSRHARTLSALFRGRVHSNEGTPTTPPRQSLILSVQGYDPNRDQAFAEAVQQDLEALFQAIVAERQGKPPPPPVDSFREMYDVSIVPADLAEQVGIVLCELYVEVW